MITLTTLDVCNVVLVLCGAGVAELHVHKCTRGHPDRVFVCVIPSIHEYSCEFIQWLPKRSLDTVYLL